MAQSSLENPFHITTKSASKQNFNSLHSYYRPIYVVSRIFGQLPFSFQFESNGNIHRPVIKMLDALWFLLSMSALICFMYFSFEYFNYGQKSADLFGIRTSFVGTNLIAGTGLILGLLTIVLDMCNRFKLVDIFKKIYSFDQRVSRNF